MSCIKKGAKMICKCSSFSWNNYNIYYYEDIFFFECKFCGEIFTEEDFTENQINNLYWELTIYE